MEEEYFKPINGYEGLYSISNYGRVFGHIRGKILSDRYDGKGYLAVRLSKNGKGKNVSVHKLVALNFVDGYQEGLFVNHIDEVITNNHYTNLEWVTAKQNTQHSYHLRNQEIIAKYGNPGELEKYNAASFLRND